MSSAKVSRTVKIVNMFESSILSPRNEQQDRFSAGTKYMSAIDNNDQTFVLLIRTSPEKILASIALAKLQYLYTYISEVLQVQQHPHH